MDSGPDIESFTISLLAQDEQPPPPPKTRRINKNLKTVLLALLLLLLLVAATMSILSSIDKRRKNRQLKHLNSYESGSGRYFCHLTVYRKLCYDSMSSVLNTTATLNNWPGPIFSTSLKVAIDQLNSVMISINKGTNNNTSRNIEARMSDCGTWVQDSLTRVNKSLSTLGLLSDFEPLSYGDIGNLKSAAGDAGQCLVALNEEKIDGVVEEVKAGVEEARKYIVNSIVLLDQRETILYEFYNPYTQIVDDDDYLYGYSYSYSYFDYRFIVGLYSLAYIFLGVLYFLFFKTT